MSRFTTKPTFCSISNENSTQQDPNTFQSIQNEAARIVTVLTRSLLLVKLYNECACITKKTPPKMYFMHKNGSMMYF